MKYLMSNLMNVFKNKEVIIVIKFGSKLKKRKS